MKKKFLATALISSFLTVNAMDHDMEIVDNLVKYGIAFQKIPMAEDCDGYKAYKTKRQQYEKQVSDFYAKAVKIFRNHNPKHEHLTIKKLRDSTYDFLHRNGLDFLFKQIAIAEIEIPTIDQDLPFPYFTSYKEFTKNHEDQGIQCVNFDDQYVIITHYAGHAGALSLFHDSKYDNIKIGTFETNYNLDGCVSGRSMIYMKNALEGYDNTFTHEAGHLHQKSVYRDWENMIYRMTTKTTDVLYTVTEMFAWIFEFRHLLEKQNLSKEYIFSLGIRFVELFDSTAKISYYFSNLAFSLANQPEKKLVDIANQAIDAIKTGVVINDGEDIRTEFTCVSDASPDEYGVDSNGVIRFNSEKNKDAIRNLLTKMGYNADEVFKKVNVLIAE